MAIPAWKRLGLNISSGAQSGAAVPGSNDQQDTTRSAESGDVGRRDGEQTHCETLASVTGKSSSLGKRKHPYDAAEPANQDPKRNRISGNQETSSGGAVGAGLDVAEVGNGEPNAQSEVADKPRPKGDPNYRQKKKKGQRSVPPGQQTTSASRQESSRPQSLTAADTPSKLLATPKFSKNLTNASGSPPPTDRRKSVTFTPDTKTVDGNSAHNLFKKWVAEQKGAQDEFTATEAAQFIPPSMSHPANGLQLVSDANTPKPKGKKKDPSLYLAYLAQYYNDHTNWKFNKAKQNDVLENALNIFRIPDQHLEALLAYVKGLKGAGVVERLKARCHAALTELDETDSKMDDREAQEIAEADALERRLSNERKRRRTERDVEALRDHPYPEGFIRRLKRRRAEALLNALNMATPLPPPLPPPSASGETETAPVAPDQRLSQRIPRKRKSRTEVSSDESSSSSSEDSTSDDSSSDDSSSDESSAEESGSEESSDDTSSTSRTEKTSSSDSDSESSSGPDSGSSGSEQETSEDSSSDESD
ncbi:uncharacterized protein EI97DRAFT_436371 [Westerdykella ornata]|uniref:WKF domain-containing protein n=1 Tax=Westerdykella ornata TaxID=318751 RepID=A0A6A6JA46_WESOR|nr:uncharacterized protein EI97DRAFT_436371 [Westerdykella ornata]KAF2273127.1 hypothetical protein EI97DRAFT_436371 [Westerdykella ornata]